MLFMPPSRINCTRSKTKCTKKKWHFFVIEKRIVHFIYKHKIPDNNWTLSLSTIDLSLIISSFSTNFATTPTKYRRKETITHVVSFRNSAACGFFVVVVKQQTIWNELYDDRTALITKKIFFLFCWFSFIFSRLRYFYIFHHNKSDGNCKYLFFLIRKSNGCVCEAKKIRKRLQASATKSNVCVIIFFFVWERERLLLYSCNRFPRNSMKKEKKKQVLKLFICPYFDPDLLRIFSLPVHWTVTAERLVALMVREFSTY